MSVTKTIEPTGDVCIKFTDEEMKQLGLKEGDKLSWRETEDGVLLEKFVKIDIDISEFSRDVLEMLVCMSCEKDVSVNEVISNCLREQTMRTD